MFSNKKKKREWQWYVQLYITPVDADMLVIKITKTIKQFFLKLNLSGGIVSGN